MYGDFELVSEIAASRIAVVHRARKNGRDYTVKVFNPLMLAEQERQDHSELDALGEDLQLKFLEAAKVQKHAAEQGSHRFAPIHDAGLSEEGAWYATDYYPRGSLKRWINQHADLTADNLHAVLFHVLEALLDLQRLTGRSHGNLKPANVLLGGNTGQALGQTPVFLSDPQPGNGSDAPRFELNDLRALGELILQLVTGREIAGPDEYNYPIEPSAAWHKLGDEQSYWLAQCNRLVDPRLTLQTCTLASLQQTWMRGRLSTNAWLNTVRFLGQKALPLLQWPVSAVAAIGQHARALPLRRLVKPILIGGSCLVLAVGLTWFGYSSWSKYRNRPPVAQPTITPNGGSYKDSANVTLACGTPGATIYYTVDGSEPTASSTRYSQPFPLTQTATVIAKAMAAGYKPSPTANAKFTMTATPTVAPTTITPQGGSHKDSVDVTLTCATPGAMIYYTVDGGEPTIRSTRYTQAFTLTKATTVKARGIARDHKDSLIVSATFEVTPTPVVAQPTFMPNGGSYKDSVGVTLTCATPGATIYYTVDGSEPTASATRYSQPFPLTQTATVIAKAMAAGYKPSPTANAKFTMTATPTVAPTTITPQGGSHKDSVDVTLTCMTPGAMIYYTVDGGEPTARSTRYTQPFTLTKATTVKARGVARDHKDSLIVSATFEVTPMPVVAQPTITPNGGSHKDSVDVTLTCATPGATIYYMVDGSEPTARSTRYTQPFTLTKATTVRARGVARDHKDSLIVSVTFEVTPTPMVAQPTIMPSGGSCKDSVDVTLTCTTPGATIYYTVDGSEPNASSTPYRQPFSLTQSTRVSAKGFAQGQKPSPTVTTTYTVTKTPVIANDQLDVTVDAGRRVSITLKGSGPERAQLKYSVIVKPRQGTLVGEPPNVEYEAVANASGEDRFTFQVSDGAKDSAPATVSIRIINKFKQEMEAAQQASTGGKYDEAKRHLQEALKLKPGNAEALQLQGQIEELLKLYAELECFKIWFLHANSSRNILNPEGYPDAGKKAGRLGIIGNYRNWYKSKAETLQAKFDTNQALTQELKTFFREQLIPAIDNW